jgi:hypothetical protein
LKFQSTTTFIPPPVIQFFFTPYARLSSFSLLDEFFLLYAPLPFFSSFVL